MQSHKDSPAKRTDNDEHTSPVRHGPTRNDKPSMPSYARWYDAVAIGMGVRMRQPRGVQRVFDG